MLSIERAASTFERLALRGGGCRGQRFAELVAKLFGATPINKKPCLVATLKPNVNNVARVFLHQWWRAAKVDVYFAAIFKNAHFGHCSPSPNARKQTTLRAILRKA